MPIDVRFIVNEDSGGKYEIRPERNSSTIRVAVPGELDLTFTQDVYEKSGLPSSAARSIDAARFGTRLAHLFADNKVIAEVVNP